MGRKVIPFWKVISFSKIKTIFVGFQPLTLQFLKSTPSGWVFPLADPLENVFFPSRYLSSFREIQALNSSSLLINMYSTIVFENLFCKREPMQNKNKAILLPLRQLCSPCASLRTVSCFFWKEVVGSCCLESFQLYSGSQLITHSFLGTVYKRHADTFTFFITNEGCSIMFIFDLIPQVLGEQCTNVRVMPSMSGRG